MMLNLRAAAAASALLIAVSANGTAFAQNKAAFSKCTAPTARRLQEDVARPIIAYYRAATCWQPRVKA
jgi:hypothetical protein